MIVENDRAPRSPWRRRFFVMLGGATLVGVPILHRARASETLTALSSRLIQQPITPGPRGFIDRAFEMRDLASQHGDQAFGAVVVKGDRIIGQSWSRVVLDDDPTGHAEMSALRDAARRAGRDGLAGAVLYSSSHPCSMCEAAAAWVGIARMVHGRGAIDAGVPRSC